MSSHGDSSMRSTAVLLGSLALLAASAGAYACAPAFAVHVVASTALHFAALAALSYAVAEHWRLKERRRLKLRPVQLFSHATAVLVTRATGLLASAYTAALPLLCPTDKLLLLVGLRVVTFFYACKLLDLTLARAHTPPLLRRDRDKRRHGLTSRAAHARYVWAVFAEMRYASFDIAVDESHRPAARAPAAALAPPLLLLPLAALFPRVAELLVPAGLLAIQLALEALHAALHPRCPRWLFWTPFAARSVTDFWVLHWHRAANPFLHGLGYVPAKRLFGALFGPRVGRAAGGLAAFSLSGVWHGWCTAPVVQDKHVWAVGAGLWAVFMLQGVAILAERWLLRDERWKVGARQTMLRVLAWAFSVETASVWLRYAMRHTKPLDWPWFLSGMW